MCFFNVCMDLARSMGKVFLPRIKVLILIFGKEFCSWIEVENLKIMS